MTPNSFSLKHSSICRISLGKKLTFMIFRKIDAIFYFSRFFKIFGIFSNSVNNLARIEKPELNILIGFKKFLWKRKWWQNCWHMVLKFFWCQKKASHKISFFSFVEGCYSNCPTSEILNIFNIKFYGSSIFLSSSSYEKVQKKFSIILLPKNFLLHLNLLTLWLYLIVVNKFV